VILPEVRIGSFEQRAPYVDFWSVRAGMLEALLLRRGFKAGRESWDEVRLVREFSQHVDSILACLQDILMSRDLQAHFANGFEAVREALKRRLASPLPPNNAATP
jgi:hypothetical protein